MGKLFFVRHGEAETNHNDILSSRYDGYPLTKLGIKQVEDTAKGLEGIKFDTLYSSPVLRTRQTAEILNKGRELEIRIDERLRERGMGKMEGEPAHKGNWIIPMLRQRKYIMEVESYSDISSRTLDFISSLPSDKNTLVATHESTISSLVCSLLGLDEFTGKGIKVGNASVTIIDLKAKDANRIIAIGSYSIDNAYYDKLCKLQ